MRKGRFSKWQIVVTLAGWILCSGVAVGQTGQELFEEWCVDCHTIGGGDLVGPDLAGVSKRRSVEWLIKAVQNSEALIDAGDPDAVALYEKYDEMAMPEIPLSDAETVAVLEYIKQVEAGGTAATAVPPADESKPTAEAIVKGQALFQGTDGFINGGAACNACHDVKSAGVMGGGTLSKDLTAAFSRLSRPAMQAIVGKPSFPVMRKAYEGKSLTDGEVAAVVAFLQHVDSEGAMEQPPDYGARLSVSGVVGAAVLLGLYSFFWRRRKRGSVYQLIYDRQIRSS